jgi:hypothetical protein
MLGRGRMMGMMASAKGPCTPPGCCGEPPCKNSWGNYCYEKNRPSLLDAMCGAMARARARCCDPCTTGCAGMACTSQGCATSGCTPRGCTTPADDSLRSPFLDDEEQLAPPGPAPDAATLRPRSSYTTFGAPTGSGLMPTPARGPFGHTRPRVQSFHSFGPVSRTSNEDGAEMGQPSLAMQIMTIPGGAQVIQNPYLQSNSDEPRLLSSEQQSGAELTSAPQEVELSPPQVDGESLDELRALPAMIRFVKPGN